MKTKIGKFDGATRTVPVRFEQDKLVHKRRVNAVVDGAGAYDAAATKVRVAEVARGVGSKFALGLLRPTPEPAPEPKADASPASVPAPENGAA